MFSVPISSSSLFKNKCIHCNTSASRFESFVDFHKHYVKHLDIRWVYVFKAKREANFGHLYKDFEFSIVKWFRKHTSVSCNFSNPIENNLEKIRIDQYAFCDCYKKMWIITSDNKALTAEARFKKSHNCLDFGEDRQA